MTLDGAEQVRAVWSRWDDLAVLASSPYCSPAWMMAWWRNVAPPGALLRVVAILDGTELVGVAPFLADRGFGGVRRYRLLGAGTSAPLDILARPGMERAVADATASALADGYPTPDVIMLEGIRGGSPWPELLCAAWPVAGGLRPYVQFSQPAPFMELGGGTYAEWFAARSSKFRSNMRRGLKEMQKHGAAVRLAEGPEALARGLEEFARLHRLRWSGRGGSGVLDERVERMLAEAGAELVEQGRFGLWSMHEAEDGRAISSQLFVSAGGTTAYWLGGFDAAATTRIQQPAILTVLAAVEHAFAAGYARLDLGAGGQPYKLNFSHAVEPVEWILLVPRGRRSLLARAQMAPLRSRIVLAQRASPRAKRLIRSALAWTSALRKR